MANSNAWFFDKDVVMNASGGGGSKHLQLDRTSQQGANPFASCISMYPGPATKAAPCDSRPKLTQVDHFNLILPLLWMLPR